MNNVYVEVEKIFQKTDDINYEITYDDSAESLWINILLENKKIGHVLVQNVEVPEIDVELYTAKWYFSLNGPNDLLQYIRSIYHDISLILSIKKHEHVKRFMFWSAKKKHFKVEIPKDVQLLKGDKIIVL